MSELLRREFDMMMLNEIAPAIVVAQRIFALNFLFVNLGFLASTF